MDGKFLTVLFTDVEGSTELLTRTGDEAASEILRIHEEIVRDQIHAHRGREVEFRGDSFLATFTSPAAALQCALTIQRALETHNRAHPERLVRVRIGLHMGSVLEQDGQLYGRVVHGAARVMAEAAGGEIFVSSDVRDACRDESEVVFLDRGLFWLKGFPERRRLYQVSLREVAPTPLEEPGEAPAHTPFVGRQAEWADLRRAIRSARSGKGGLVFVTGEAGVGKSRFVREVTGDAEARGMRCLLGHCVEMEGGTPYLPFVEILENALIAPRSPLVLRDALGEHAAEIARLVPPLRRILPDVPAPLDLPPEQAQRYLWASVEGFLRQAAQDRPLILVLEDLHWADEATLLLLGYLTPHLGDMPVLLIGTYRDTEVDPDHRLARLIDHLTRRRLVRRTSLRPLPEDAVAQMLTALAGQEPPPELVRGIYEGTEGNPFFVEEVFLHLSETESLLDPSGRFRADLRIDELDVPESVRFTVGGRLARLSPEARKALSASAISGRVFEPAVVGIVSGLDGDALASAFGEAEAARLVAPSRSDGRRSSFVHELIRQTLLAETPSLKRQQLHADTARAIEEIHREHIEDHAADLVFHLTRAGHAQDPHRLVHFLRIAGDRALSTAAFAQAVSHFEHALTLMPSEEQEARAEFLERLANALRSTGNWEDALSTMDRTLEIYERLDRREAIGRLCWAMVYQLTWAARFEEAVAISGRGLTALNDLPNPDRARLLSVTGWVTGLAGDHGSATQLFHAARELAEALGDRRALADVLHMETAHHMTYLEFAQGAEAGRRGALVFEAEGALWELCSVLAFVEFQLGTILRNDEASALVDRVTRLALRLGHLGALFLVLSDRIRREGVIAGDLALTRSLAHEEIEVCRQGSLPWLYVGHLYLGFTADWAGRPKEAERELRRALALEPPGAFSGQCATHLALHLARRGRAQEVLSLFEQVRPTLPVPGRINSLGQWNTLLGFAEALHLIGRTEDVAALHPLIPDALALGEWITFDCRLVGTRAGITAAAAGLWDEAERHFEGALATAQELGHRIEMADIHRFHAAMLVARDGPGDERKAEDHLQTAAQLYNELGIDRQAAIRDAAVPDAGGPNRVEARVKGGSVPR